MDYPRASVWFLFFFNDTATTEIYTLSLHDALPISLGPRGRSAAGRARAAGRGSRASPGDRKSTRLNSSHGYISYAVFCLKKKTLQHMPYALLNDPTAPDHIYTGLSNV